MDARGRARPRSSGCTSSASGLLFGFVVPHHFSLGREVRSPRGGLAAHTLGCATRRRRHIAAIDNATHKL
jgi:hypothetical protein